MNFCKNSQNAAILKKVKTSRNCHGRFTANYQKFVSSVLIQRKMWYNFTPTFLKIWKIWAICFSTLIYISFAVPSSAPVIQNSSALSSTSIRIVFIGLTSNSLNGILTGYHIFMKSPISQKTIITNSTIINVGNLQKFHRYEIYVVACNRVGCGPKSKSVFVTTHDDSKFFSCSLVSLFACYLVLLFAC